MGEKALALKGFRRERGLLWPDYDQRCAEVTFGEVDGSLPQILDLVERRRVVVQAGGNCGQMVIALVAAGFDAVYTFEPDPRNFVALTVNTAHMPNVFRIQAALETDAGGVSLADGDPKFAGSNCGALYVAGRGRIPSVQLDALRLPLCDLLMLDVEGAEFRALTGASETISRCRPLVVIEDKGLGARFYGEAKHAAQQWLTSCHGYRNAGRIKNDTVMVPA